MKLNILGKLLAPSNMSKGNPVSSPDLCYQNKKIESKGLEFFKKTAIRWTQQKIEMKQDKSNIFWKSREYQSKEQFRTLHGMCPIRES